MKKGLWMVLAGLMTLGTSVSAFASARLDSMAADARQVGDIDLIWLYPNMVVDYKNTVDFRLSQDPYGDFGNGTNEWGGALLEVDPDFGVLGVYVNRPNDLDSVNYDLLGSGPVRPIIRYAQNRIGNTPWLMNDSNASYSNQVDLFWGKNIGGNDFGLHFNYGAGGTESSVYSLDAGLGLGNVGPFGDLNVHAGYATETFGNDGSADKSNGIYTAKLGAISTSALNADNDLRLFADLQLDGFKNTVNADYSDWALDLGAAVNRKIDGGKGLLSTGIILDYIAGSSPASSADFNIDEYNLFWNGSIEAPVADWLTVRAGLSKMIVARVYDRNNFYGDGVYYDNSNNNVQFSTGFGINWQNFTLNGDVSAASLENSIKNVQPGKGLFFNNGNIVTVESADLSYKF